MFEKSQKIFENSWKLVFLNLLLMHSSIFLKHLENSGRYTFFLISFRSSMCFRSSHSASGAPPGSQAVTKIKKHPKINQKPWKIDLSKPVPNPFWHVFRTCRDLREVKKISFWFRFDSRSVSVVHRGQAAAKSAKSPNTIFSNAFLIHSSSFSRLCR